jgi:hypothetical protein
MCDCVQRLHRYYLLLRSHSINSIIRVSFRVYISNELRYSCRNAGRRVEYLSKSGHWKNNDPSSPNEPRYACDAASRQAATNPAVAAFLITRLVAGANCALRRARIDRSQSPCAVKEARGGHIQDFVRNIYERASDELRPERGRKNGYNVTVSAMSKSSAIYAFPAGSRETY